MELDCQYILKIGFGFVLTITYFFMDLDWIDNPKKWMEQ